MSGDVQPRKRKDKKKKKDELTLEESRGTAAALGEGDVFLHSHSDHGTGGHWCAKIIFFSLLAVLITLIGLIIIENRGLSELEANAVESRYSGILEGWIEDAPDDDHHDIHTLELKHQEEDDDHEDGDDDEDNDEETEEVEVEKIEEEVDDQEPIDVELPPLPEEDADSADEKDEDEDSNDSDDGDDDDDDDNDKEDDDNDDDDDFLEQDVIFEEPIVERIAVPAGKPYAEVDDDDSTEHTPVDTLAEEEEYERRQEELRKQEAEASHEDGGNSVDDEWPGEPDDPFWKKEVDKAEDELEQGQWSAVIGRASSPQLAKSLRARFIAAKAYDQLAEEKRDNKILSKAINAYVELLKNSDRISDKKLLEIASRTIERMRFRGTYMSTEPIHRLLIRRFPDDVSYRNNFTVSFLMANRADLAEEILKETLKKWSNDRVALAQYGFILKTQYNRLEDALEYLSKALENDTGPATEPRFYYHLGDTLLLLGRFNEAHEVHKRAAKHGHFLSPSQRSLYNVPRLKGKPWWNVNETPYERLAKSLEQNWRSILKEGLAAKALYEEEKEGLREKGEWSQLDLFARGFEVGGRCSRAPVTCAAVRAEPAAVGCRRGQVKFSSIEPGTHVRPHVGPTNCRLRMHLGLSNTKYTYIRVDKETRQWQEGKVFIFDDSFEHEVWHNGTGSRLVLIVDVWHPDLTPQERRTLPAI